VTDSPLVDRVRLAMLTGGDADLHRELTELFALQGRRYLDELAQMAADGDHDGVGRAAHRLRGAASNLGAARLGVLAGTVEQLAATGADACGLVGEARRVFEVTCAELMGDRAES